ncbi:MAG: RNA methyltransferase [Oligoflexales bacterium]|nr:RNA methyltransferase [Oligoflexales bacterium]
MIELFKNAAFDYPDDAWILLSKRLTPQRRERMQEVVGQRTGHLRLMMQDIHDQHNISACFRSAEAFGILNVDVINTYEKFKRSGVSRGTDRWLVIRRWNSIDVCAEYVKGKGYKIAAGFPGKNNMSLMELPVKEPVAVLFGNEHSGIDEKWDDYIDYKFTVPMDGMVESLNISVSAALSLFELKRRALLDVPAEKYYVCEEERKALLSRWVCLESRNYEAELAILRGNS